MHDHLTALNRRLANEKERLAHSISANETALRTRWIAQIEKEISSERSFLGIKPMTDDEIDGLLAELAA